MSVRIKVSYEHEEELAKVIRLLTPKVKSCKVAKRQTGQYRRAYINLKPREMLTNVNVENAKKC